MIARRISLPGHTPSASAPSTHLHMQQPHARLRLHIRGVVQGVGFRPFVHRLAKAHHLGGFVRNNSAGVIIEVEGSAASLTDFQSDLTAEMPPAAQIDAITTTPLEVHGEQDFYILDSDHIADAQTLVSPDLAICDDCLRELFDPADRRYRYPFINCTNCGPRYTIVHDVPYDRPLTAMSAFALCQQCQHEYDTPEDRRFHAQPNACPACGPRLEFMHFGKRAAAEPTLGEEALRLTQRLLAQGGIVAIKGIGGYHLACDATNHAAVNRLRGVKARGDKPFAIMARDLDSLQQIAHLAHDELAAITSRARPIVLLKRKLDAPISPAVAPGNPCIGVMLPYTPLHHLLFAPATPTGDKIPPWLVMTSANHAGEPIVSDDIVAHSHLADLADAILSHNRPILHPCDDSVLRVVDSQPLPIRRARGYAPLPITLPIDVPPILAVGGEIKNTLCIAQGEHAFISQHIGDMQTLETQATFAATAEHFQKLFRIEPELAVSDLHPAYLSTQWAARWQQLHPTKRVVHVQHHHAHVAALMAEHNLRGDERVIGICFDGTGYGPDGAIWGGEVLLANYEHSHRAAHLAYLPLPGGDAAIEKPYRMALAALWAAGITWHEKLPPVAIASRQERTILQRQLETGLNCVPTSSMGRLFDAVASLCGVRHHATYEAQAAIELEALVIPLSDSYHFGIIKDDPSTGSAIRMDATPVLQAIVRDIQHGLAQSLIATRFHNAVVDLIVDICQEQRAQTGLQCVALTGGVFQNEYLLYHSVRRLRAAGFDPRVHRQVPPNDGGIALGQVMVAAYKERASCV